MDSIKDLNSGFNKYFNTLNESLSTSSAETGSTIKQFSAGKKLDSRSLNEGFNRYFEGLMDDYEDDLADELQMDDEGKETITEDSYLDSCPCRNALFDYIDECDLESLREIAISLAKWLSEDDCAEFNRMYDIECFDEMPDDEEELGEDWKDGSFDADSYCKEINDKIGYLLFSISGMIKKHPKDAEKLKKLYKSLKDRVSDEENNADIHEDLDDLCYCPQCGGERFSDKTGLCIDCGYDEKEFGNTDTDDYDDLGEDVEEIDESTSSGISERDLISFFLDNDMIDFSGKQ